MSAADPSREFLAYAAAKLEQSSAQVLRCATLLSPEQLWHRPAPQVNSIANLLLHLTGNVRQWILTGLGGQPDTRDRPAEFTARGPRPVAELTEPLRQTVAAAVALLRGLPAGALARLHTIQGYRVAARIAVFHVVEHFSFHTGQIVQATRLLREMDLSLYDAQGHKRGDAAAAGWP